MKGCVSLPPDRQKKVLGLFVRDPGFYRSFFPLLAVITLQQLSALAVNMADNIMLGTYTELALSGATLVNQLQFALQQIASGTGLGVVVLASQYWGKGQTGPIKKIISLGLKFSMAVGAVFFLLGLLVPKQVLGLLTNDQAVIDEAARYLKIICWTYLIFSLSNSLMYALQSVQTAFIGTVMSISTICINICLNYCLIYGNFGAPELGIVGAAIATLVSRVAELAIILVYVLLIDRKLRTKPAELFSLDFTYLGDYLRVAVPVAISGLLWGVAQAAQTAVLGHISAEAIAANSIATVVFQIFAVVGMSSANTASVIIGKTVGEGRLDIIRPYVKTIQGIFLIIGLLSGALMFVFRNRILDLYAISEQTRQLALEFLTVLCIVIPGSCYEYPVEGGIIAGGGVTNYAAVVDNLFMWLFTIPSACLSAFVFHFPPLVTFCCLKADQLLKCIPNAITCNRFGWVKILTRS